MKQLSEATEIAQRLLDNIGLAIVGKERVIELSLISLIARGHLLIEDMPGLGKTTLAKAIAISTGCSFKRIQFVPDILPSDITGVNIYSQKTGEFEFRPGPIMAQVVLADEINRAPSKTQAALLEVMEERQTTVDGVTYQMSEPFFLIATMNPIEYHGIFPLPEAQIDRFIMRVSLGYATPDQELAIIERQQTQHPLEGVSPVTTPEQLIFLQDEVKEVYVDPLVRQYIVSISQTSRQHSEIALGISHRGSLAMFRTAQALALVRQREFVVPDDVKELAPSVLAHRIILTPEARARGLNGEKVITGILDNLQVPGVS